MIGSLADTYSYQRSGKHWFDRTILIQRENPALPVSDECSDAQSEPRSEQGVNERTDHVHILFGTKPTTDLTKFINSLKGVTSRRIRSEFPEVKQTLEDAFWQPGYFLATTGQVSIDVLMDYVDGQ